MRTFATPDQLLRTVRERVTAGDRSVVLAGIDGCGGSGKSAIAAWIARSAPDVAVVHMDDFYRPQDGRLPQTGCPKPLCWTFDWRRLEREVLAPLAAGAAARFQKYDWESGRLDGWGTVRPVGVTVVEGVTSVRLEIARYYDVTVWVECPKAIRLRRGLERDGAAARGIWVDEWMPAEDRYIAKQAPAERVDLVVDGSTFLSGAS